jgi:hypothetical protein
MKKLLSVVLAMGLFFSMSIPLLADSTTTTLAPAPAAAVAAPEKASLSLDDFLAQVLAAVQKFGGLSVLLKVSAVILLLVASMKVSFLNQLIWSKLGAFQSAVAPLLGIIAGLFGLFGGGAPVTLASVFAYFLSGVGAVGLHEFLDDVKAIPGIGAGYIAVINAIESILGGGEKT